MPSDLPAGCRERFEPIERIGKGAQATVWLVRHRELGHQVALKLLRVDDPTDLKAAQRFRQEARVTAALAHPAIVKLLDCDVSDGTPWIAYEYVPGRALSEVLEE